MGVHLNILFIVVFVAYQTTGRDLNKREVKCYGDLGCFESYHSVPLPASPETIATTFRLHVRGTSHTYNLPSIGYESRIASWMTHMDFSKKTKILIHGYLDNAAKPWMGQMTSELLKKGDFNVIVVDWGHGALTSYDHAAGNTYLVGKETAMLINYLHSHGLNYDDVHLIGHSLGAQVAGHVGHEVRTLARITGLDPADPLFSGTPNDRHLDASDAAFVDVIHTDASKFNIVSGYGTHDAVGDIDFYPNGGQDQPGCEEHPVGGAVNNLLHGALSGVASSVTCSHSRSRDLFIESINSNCHFYGHLCPTADNFEAGACLGCPAGGCPMMGYDADHTANQRGTFYLSTSGTAPFCGHEYFVDLKASERMLHTYGEFMITLVGTSGSSEPLKFESQMHGYDHGAEERHVIATHSDIGTVTSIKLEFVKARGAHGFLSMSYIKVHSVEVTSAETSQSVTFCAHEHHFNSGDTQTVTSTSGC